MHRTSSCFVAVGAGREGMEHNVAEPVDVICQFNKDGGIIPLRVRIVEDDGEYHAYTIQSYRDMSYRGAYTTSGGVFVSNSTLYFECNIMVLGMLKTIRLYYDTGSRLWKISM